jgi:hypothetical protein
LTLHYKFTQFYGWWNILYTCWRISLGFGMRLLLPSSSPSCQQSAFFFIFTVASKFDSSLELSHFDQGILRIVIGIFCKTLLSHHILVKHCKSQEIKIILKNKMVLPTYLPYFFYVPFLVNSTHKVPFKKKNIPCPFSVLDKTLYLNCQICAWRRWTAKAWSAFEGKTWPWKCNFSILNFIQLFLSLPLSSTDLNLTLL